MLQFSGAARRSRMNFSQYIDLDRELQGGAPADAERLSSWAQGRSREAAAGADDEALLLEWVGDEACGGEGSIGSLAQNALRWTIVTLFLLGFLAGAGAAGGLLRYDGSQPINVLWFLALIVGIQILMIPLLVLAFFFRRQLRGGWRLARALFEAVMSRVIRTTVARRIGGVDAQKLEADWGRLKARHSLYAQVEPTLLLVVVQSFGVAFNLGVISCLAFLVLFSDLSFAWSTTLQVEAAQVHGVTSAISAPWAFLWPDARPSLELVQATRFVRLDGAFVGGIEDAGLRAGGWWPFLMAATITYGLLPRLLALFAGSLLVRREIRRAIGRNSQVQALTDRLRAPLVWVDSDSAAPGRRPPDSAVADAAPAAQFLPGKELRLGAVFWAYDSRPAAEKIDDVLQQVASGKLGFSVDAGHLDSAEDEAIARVKAGLEAAEIDGAAVFFEPFEPLKGDARRFLQNLRRAMTDNAPIIALLAEFAGDDVIPSSGRDVLAWERAVQTLADPFLFVRAVSNQ